LDFEFFSFFSNRKVNIKMSPVAIAIRGLKSLCFIFSLLPQHLIDFSLCCQDAVAEDHLPADVPQDGLYDIMGRVSEKRQD